MAPTPYKRASIGKEDYLLRQSGRKAKARQAGNVEDNDRVRLEYAERTNGDIHDDRGVLGVNRGENWTNLSKPNPGDE